MSRTVVVTALAALIILAAAWAASAGENDFDGAMGSYMEGDYEAAVEKLRQYVAARPEAKAYYLMGYAVYAIERQGDKRFGDSAMYFSEAYLIDPDFDPATVIPDK